MFSRKKKTPSPGKKERADPSLPFGLGIPGFQSNHEENDSDLEAELFALTGERSNGDIIIDGCDGDDDLEAELARIIGTEKKNVNTQFKKEPVDVVVASNPMEESDADSDDLDENDPELLSELKSLTVVSEEENDDSGSVDVVEEVKETVSQLDLITKRLTLYRDAESSSKAKKDLARARRYSRGIKTLEQLLKKAQAGVFVPFNEIPPEIATNLKPDAPIVEPRASSFKLSSIMDEEQKYHKMDPPTDLVTENVADETPQDIVPENDLTKSELSDMPMQNNPKSTQRTHDTIEVIKDSPPAQEDVPYHSDCINNKPLLTLLASRKDEFRNLALAAKKSGNIQLALAHMRDVKGCEKLITMHKSGIVISQSDIPQLPTEAKKPIKSDAPIQNSAPSGVPFLTGEVFTSPKTVQEALNQRLNYYIKAMQKAESMGQRNDLRKIENIVKIYQNAIKLHSRGGSVPFQKLPTPPGCPPIPMTFQLA